MAAEQQTVIPLFPLSTVLFPGGPLSLRIFETRYLDMVSHCLKHEQGFGVVLIRAGRETGEADFHRLGTLAHIRDWDRLEDGLLGITALGGDRFEWIETWRADDGLYWGRVQWLPSSRPPSLPPECRHLARVVRELLPQLPRPWRLVEPHFDDADWVGFRLAEVLPISPEEKQALLALGDPTARLARIQAYFETRNPLDEEDA